MTTSFKTPNKTARAQPASNLMAFDCWRDSIPITAATGWRWRKRGWIVVQNIAGRVYVTRAAIAEFERRAAAGEFSTVHKTPSRKEVK